MNVPAQEKRLSSLHRKSKDNVYKCRIKKYQRKQIIKQQGNPFQKKLLKC